MLHFATAYIYSKTEARGSFKKNTSSGYVAHEKCIICADAMHNSVYDNTVKNTVYWKYHEECSLFDNTIPTMAHSKRRKISIRKASPCTYCTDMEEHAVTQQCSLNCWGGWQWNIWTGHSQTQWPSAPFKCKVKQQKLDNNQKSKFYILH